MTKISRAYQEGDHLHINYLYKLVTGTDRSRDEYAWEWLNTWDGPGSVWLVFDDSREADDQLIAQYSLLPTPFSFWGKKYLAGKTENCMSHPDYRGKGMYFFHEKENFEKAKDKFQLFITTTGDVARGAPGKVRMKLGYRPFDHWVTYSYWLNKEDLQQELKQKLPKLIAKFSLLANTLAGIVGQLVLWYSKTSFKDDQLSNIEHDEHEAPLAQIESLWQNNAEIYGVSVDRNEAYLKWRINDNPYNNHHCLSYYEAGVLKGYLIYTSEGSVLYVVDILADLKSDYIFKALLDKLILIGREAGYSQIKCYTASKNHLLINVLRRHKFANWAESALVKGWKKSTRDPQIFVYVSESVKGAGEHWEGQNWYITDLIKEGRPYVGRTIA